MPSDVEVVLPPKKKWYETKKFIAAVGSFVAAGVALLGYAMEWDAATYPIVYAFVGAGLAVWKTGAGAAE